MPTLMRSVGISRALVPNESEWADECMSVDPLKTPPWEFMAISVMGSTAPSIALEGLDAAVERVRALNEDQLNIRPAFVALTEGTWWVAALDEHMNQRLGREAARHYKMGRDKDQDGRFIRGFLWARDRHTHQLPVSMDRDDTWLFGSKRGVMHISAGFRWLPSEQLYEPEAMRDKRPGWRQAYDDLLAGQSAWKTLNRCSRWFHKMAGHVPMD